MYQNVDVFISLKYVQNNIFDNFDFLPPSFLVAT
jgi:hypothetical protein